MLEQEADRRFSISVYVFGSVLRGGSNWSDVDILIVVDDKCHVDRVTQLIHPVAEKFPLHSTILIRSEFYEIGSKAWGSLHGLVELAN